MIELFLVIGVITILTVTILPALASTKSQSRVNACAANFRQWAVAANLYAKDNQEWLPSYNVSGGGMYAWDVGTNMCNALGPYGMAVPDWFCPMRPNELDAANKWAQQQAGRPIRTMDNLREYFSRYYPEELNLTVNYWVTRAQGSTKFPTDYSNSPFVAVPTWARGTEPATYGWPRKLHDNAAAHVPFVSDLAASGNGAGFALPPSGVVSSSTDDVSPNTAHFVNSTLIGVNAAFVDGRVEDRPRANMRAVYTTSGNTYWFY